MIRFIDLSSQYWLYEEEQKELPVAGFLDTTRDRFFTTPEGGHVFMSLEAVKEHPQAERLLAVIPKTFKFKPLGGR